MQFSQDDAQISINILSTLIIPFVVVWITKVTWKGYQKFLVVALLSLLVGALKSYVAGELSSASSIIRNGAVILTASQSAYHALFQYLGLHKYIQPVAVMIEQGKQQVAEQLRNTPNDVAKDVIDPNTPPAVKVEATVQ